MKKTAKKAEKKQSGGGQLIPDAQRKTTFRVEPGRLLVYPEGHPRFDERSKYPADPAMVQNVIALGVRVAIKVEIVRPGHTYTGTDGKEHDLPPGLYVVDGHQRRAWALGAIAELARRGEPAGLTVEVDPENRGREAADEDVLASLSFALNRHVPDDPLVTARKLQGLNARLGGDLARVARETGHPPVFVRRHLALLGADKAVQKAVQAGTVSVSAASELARLPPAEQKREIEKASAGEKPTVRSTRARSRPEGPVPPTRRQIKAVLEALVKHNTPAPHNKLIEGEVVLGWVLTGNTDGTQFGEFVDAALEEES